MIGYYRLFRFFTIQGGNQRNLDKQTSLCQGLEVSSRALLVLIFLGAARIGTSVACHRSMLNFCLEFISKCSFLIQACLQNRRGQKKF